MSNQQKWAPPPQQPGYAGGGYNPPQVPAPQGSYGGQEPPPPVPPHPAPNYTVTAQNAQGPAFEEKFKVDRPKYNDVWAAVLFLIDILGFGAVAGISIQGIAATMGFQGGSSLSIMLC